MLAALGGTPGRPYGCFPCIVVAFVSVSVQGDGPDPLKLAALVFPGQCRRPSPAEDESRQGSLPGVVDNSNSNPLTLSAAISMMVGNYYTYSNDAQNSLRYGVDVGAIRWVEPVMPPMHEPMLAYSVRCTNSDLAVGVLPWVAGAVLPLLTLSLSLSLCLPFGFSAPSFPFVPSVPSVFSALLAPSVFPRLLALFFPLAPLVVLVSLFSLFSFILVCGVSCPPALGGPLNARPPVSSVLVVPTRLVSVRPHLRRPCLSLASAKCPVSPFPHCLSLGCPVCPGLVRLCQRGLLWLVLVWLVLVLVVVVRLVRAQVRCLRLLARGQV